MFTVAGPARACAVPAAVPLRTALTRLELWSLVALCLCGQIFVWVQSEGYYLADAVEYVEGARKLVHGQAFEGAVSLRSFGFSLVFVPLFALERLFGLEDPRFLMLLARLVQMGLALALVLCTARLAARFAGPRAAWLAGAVLVANPFFVQYGVVPIADIGAALAIVLAAERLLWRSGARASFAGGLLLGLAVLFSYKSLLVVAALALGLIARDRWRHKATWLAVLAGLALIIVLQCGLDWLARGSFGSSLLTYVYFNALSRLTYFSWKVHVATDGWISEQARDVALWTQRVFQSELGLKPRTAGFADRMRLGPYWYLANLPDMLMWPVIVLGAFGLARWLDRPKWTSSLALCVVAAFVFVTSTKGDKSFRLWLPIAPFLALLAASGWEALASLTPRAWIRRLAPVAIIALALPGTFQALEATPMRRHGAYWQAMEHVNETADRGARVGAAFDWAVFLRARPDLELAKSPVPLEQYPTPAQVADSEGALRERDALHAWLDGLDWFITHTSMLARPELLRFVSERFSVVAIHYEQVDHAALGPVLVLRHAAPESVPERPMLRVRKGAEALDFLAAHPVSCRKRFERTLPDGTLEAIEFLGYDVERLAGSPDALWLTYHWTTDTGLATDFQFVDRWTSFDGRWAYQNNRWPGYAAHRTRDWVPGEVLSEGYVFFLAADPFGQHERTRPLGGPYRRGDLIPVSLWLQLLAVDERGSIRDVLQGEHPLPQRLIPPLDNAGPAFAEFMEVGRPPAAALEEVALRWRLTDEQRAELQQRWEVARATWLQSGSLLSKDGLIEVDRAFFAVSPGARLADDGKSAD